ncbi:MAG: DsbA family protein [Bacteroidetes bacterium]|nr:DsbA family protein [Bacteroidota bacterium]
MSIQSNTEILYFYDALCGWCYGFSPVIREFAEKYGNSIRFRVISGGMMMGNRKGPWNEVAPYVKEGAWKTVEQRTGIRFGEKFLNEILEPGTSTASSLEPAIAMSVFKSFETDKEVQFASALQRAVYYDGVESTDLNAYIPYAVELGVDETEFRIRLNDPVYHDRAFDDFRICQRFGVQGFPTTVLLHEDQYYLIGSGYSTLEILEARMKELLGQVVY